MLHAETVLPSTLELLKKMMEDECLNQFRLVGGTSLSLQLGHRISVDLDLFTSEPFDAMELSVHLNTTYEMETDFLARNTIKGEIHGVQIDCIAHQYPWIEDYTIEEGIRLASITDISAMKLNAISGTGTRIKDFIDIACLSSLMSLEDMLNAYKEKYRANILIPLKSLTYWNDINFKEPIRMLSLKQIQWEDIKTRLLEMQANPHMRFKPL